MRTSHKFTNSHTPSQQLSRLIQSHLTERAILPPYPRTLNFLHSIPAPQKHHNQPQPNTQHSDPRMAQILARVRRPPYLVEALAPCGGRSGGPLLLAAIGVVVAGNPSSAALAAHLKGDGGGQAAAVVRNGGLGNRKEGRRRFGILYRGGRRGCTEIFPALLSDALGGNLVGVSSIRQPPCTGGTTRFATVDMRIFVFVVCNHRIKYFF